MDLRPWRRNLDCKLALPPKERTCHELAVNPLNADSTQHVGGVSIGKEGVRVQWAGWEPIEDFRTHGASIEMPFKGSNPQQVGAVAWKKGEDALVYLVPWEGGAAMLL